MTLSTSRQQFLAYETQASENIQYGRKGGIFVSHCICTAFILFGLLAIVISGVIGHFVTFYQMESAQQAKQFWDETERFGQTSSPSPDLRLPSAVVPSFYRLKIKADLDNSSFSGEVYITVRANTIVKEIILHAKNLTIDKNAKLIEQIYEVERVQSRPKRQVSDPVKENSTTVHNDTVTTSPEMAHNATISTTSSPVNSSNATSPAAPAINVTEVQQTTVATVTPMNTQVSHSNARSIKILQIMESTGDRLVLVLASTLKPNVDYILQLSFSGKISNSLTGFYKSTYINKDKQEKQLGVTQFEPTSARAAFPCFDEPAFKAKFEISIAHSKNVSVLSNMKAVTQEPVENEPNWQWTHFERSVDMSTYLVAYILSDFKSLETTYLSKDNVTKTIKIWTQPDMIGNAKYALNITSKLLSYYEDVFGIPYALEKIDLIAIPDFSSGAMENWGLITFRETTLLFDEAEAMPRIKQSVAIDVAHELAHQWFGNLVTMKWWTDLWLNEGFATYIEYVGVDHVEPQWKMLESFSRDKMDLLRSDALKNTLAVSREVVDASEIAQKFDEISYTKGANLIRMLNHTVTEQLFHKGLKIFLNEWKYSNAEENDLWNAISKAVKDDPAMGSLSVVEFMNSWTRQAGYPVLSVNRNYKTGSVELEQRLFTGAKEPYQAMVDQLWHIPVSYTSVSAPGDQWSTKPKAWLKKRFDVVNIPINASEALYVNVDAIGYYRVNYDKTNWELLGAALKSGRIASPITRAQLIDDAFNLARSGHLDYIATLDLAASVANGDDSKVVWDLVLNNMAFLRYNMRTTSGYRYFQDFIEILIKKQLESVNYGLSKPKSDNEAFLVENLVMWECFTESPRCLQWTQDQFDAWVKTDDINNNPIPSHLRSLVYNTALRRGGRREFDFLWRAFNNSTDPIAKTIIINNLPATMDEGLITLLLEKSLSEIPSQYAVAAWSVEPPVGTRIAQDFLIDHFQKVYDRFNEIDSFTFPAVLSGAFSFISTDSELDRLKSFAIRHKEQLLPMSQTLQKLVDSATVRIAWTRKHAPLINQWLKAYVTAHNSKASAANTSTGAPPAAVTSTTSPPT